MCACRTSLWNLAAQILIKLSHLKAFILSFPLSSNKKPEIHFQSWNWNLMRFWRCYYLEPNQLLGKPWGFLTYFQWHLRIQALFSCSHSFQFNENAISIKETLSKKLRSGLQKLTGTCQEYFGLQIHLEMDWKVDFFSRGSDFWQGGFPDSILKCLP